jgi:preprotein translocase subunit Sec63
VSRLVALLLLVGVVLLVLRALRARVPGRHAVEGGDPWAVLGVPRGASREEITRAYRERLKEYHPDRVAQLGTELRDLAHRKTVEIRRAYETLTGS